MSKLEEQEGIVVLGIVAFFILFFIVAAFIRGWVLSILWAWFFVPLGLPDIGVWHALGISFVVGFLTYHYNKFERSEDSDFTKVLGESLVPIILPFVVLGMGWFVHLLM